MANWINVKKKLPEFEKEVMVAMDAGKVGNPKHPGYPGKKWVEKSYRIKNLNSFMTELIQTGYVTHWMPVNEWSDEVVVPSNDE